MSIALRARFPWGFVMVRAMSRTAAEREALLDRVLDLQHDLGKYLRLPLRMLPGDAPANEVHAALREALLETRRAGAGVKSARSLWEAFAGESAAALAGRECGGPLGWALRGGAGGAAPVGGRGGPKAHPPLPGRRHPARDPPPPPQPAGGLADERRRHRARRRSGRAQRAVDDLLLGR